MLKAIPYLLPFTIPFLSLLGIEAGGWWVLSGFGIAYVVHPVLDLIGGEDLNPEFDTGLSEKVHSLLLWLYLPVQTYILYAILKLSSTQPFNSWELFGIILTTGTVTGGMGITVAHELVHRRARWERGIGVALLAMVNYGHFRVEHVFGHHKHVSTPVDAATARPGESLYHFLFRSVTTGWLSAWRMESKRKKSFLHHRLVHYILLQLALALSIGFFLGSTALVVYLAQSVVAFLTLEVINYIEHYGLQRKELSPGVYEAVTELHSWDSRHRMTNWFLFNLGRHAHHHAAPTVPYEKLRPGKTMNALKYGYSAQMILAFIGKSNRAVSSKLSWPVRPPDIQ